MQYIIGLIAAGVVLVSSSATPFASTPPQTGTFDALLCGAKDSAQRLDHATVTYSRAAALARSGRGSQLAMSNARSDMMAAHVMADRAQFALAEAEAAFGPLPRIKPARC